MDSFIERVRSLTENKYFAYIAIIFFAFLTALVFAIMALQSSTPEDIREQVQNQVNQQVGTSNGSVNNTNESGSIDGSSQTSSGTSNSSQPSIVDRIIDALTGRRQENPDTTSETQQSGIGGSNEDTQSVERVIDRSTSMPDIQIDKFVLTTELPQKPASMQVYQVKNSFTPDDIQNLAYDLGFEIVDAVEDGASTSQLYDIDNEQYLGFHKGTGHFTFISEIGLQPDSPASTPTQTAKNVLAQLGLDHPSMQPYATYKRKDDRTDMVYVEMHANWSTIGAPIINPLGILNLSQDEPLSSLTIGKQDLRIPDENIIDTSDNADGLARPSGFNTVTMKISEADGKIYNMSYEAPHIIGSEAVASTAIKSPVQAFSDYTKGNTSLGITGPTGSGNISLADIYSGNTAASETVDVADIEIVYPQTNSHMPSYWCPSYTFTSYGKVQTGFDVKYVHTVPAVSDSRCQASVLGETTELAQTQPGPFVTSPTPDKPNVPITQVVGPTNDPLQSGSKAADSLQYGTIAYTYTVVVDTPVNECPPNFTNSYSVGETADTLEYIAWIDPNQPNVTLEPGQETRTFGNGTRARIWYYVVKQKQGSQAQLTSLSPSKTKNEVIAIRNKIFSRTCKIGKAHMCPKDPQVDSLATVSCKYLLTASPWLYAYSDFDQTVDLTVNPIGGMQYAQPALNGGNTWSVTTQRNGNMLFNNRETDGLLWEYHKESVKHAYAEFEDKPNKGFIVSADQFKPFMAGLMNQIGLNEQEKKNALAELNRESSKIESPFVKVAFVPTSFVDEAFPLSISPAPDSVNRVYFEITELGTYQHIETPKLPVVSRNGLTIVETGYLFR